MNVKICDGWDACLDDFPPEKKDIYYTEEYTKLYEDNENIALCVICEDKGNILLMPFLRKEISSFYDFETAYGYGGPIANTDDRMWIGEALAEISECFKKEKYVCGFIRFHPLLDNSRYCGDIMEVTLDRHTVTVDLHQEEAEIWKTQISSKNRNMIRKAERIGLEYQAEYDFASMEDFIRLYNGTMERLGADEFYYFGNGYYQNYAKNISGRGFLGTVRYEEKMIGAALFMYSECFGHYHLAGSDRAYAGYGINNFLLWNTIRELKKRNVEEFHLGGGTGASVDDSLFKFKRSFSKNLKDFYIGKCIFDCKNYARICEEWEKENAALVPIYGDRLLKYRYKEMGHGKIDG